MVPLRISKRSAKHHFDEITIQLAFTLTVAAAICDMSMQSYLALDTYS